MIKLTLILIQLLLNTMSLAHCAKMTFFVSYSTTNTNLDIDGDFSMENDESFDHVIMTKDGEKFIEFNENNRKSIMIILDLK